MAGSPPARHGRAKGQVIRRDPLPAHPPRRRTPLRTRTELQPSGPWSRSVPLLTTGKSAARRIRGSPRAAPPEFTPKVSSSSASGPGWRRVPGAVRGVRPVARPRRRRVPAPRGQGCGGECRRQDHNGQNSALVAPAASTGRRGQRGPRPVALGMAHAGFGFSTAPRPPMTPGTCPGQLASPHGSGVLVHLAADGLGEDGSGYALADLERGTSWAS